MKKSVILLHFLFFCFTSCEKKSTEHPVPYSPVNLTLFVSDPQFFPLNVVGGWTYLAGGSRGLIIYRRGNEEFVAFDRHCPYKVQDPCGLVSVDSLGFAALDTCCGSGFQLYDGAVTKGPATFPLKAYQTSYDGNRLDIFN